MNNAAKRRGKEKREKANFAGKACWVGVDVHKANYAVAILDGDGRRLEFSAPAEPKKLLLQLLKMGVTVKALAHESGPAGYGLPVSFPFFWTKYFSIPRIPGRRTRRSAASPVAAFRHGRKIWPGHRHDLPCCSMPHTDLGRTMPESNQYV